MLQKRKSRMVMSTVLADTITEWLDDSSRFLIDHTGPATQAGLFIYVNRL